MAKKDTLVLINDEYRLKLKQLAEEEKRSMKVMFEIIFDEYMKKRKNK